jgi:pimeloyl-ACP methyl ester carboxylesterase
MRAEGDPAGTARRADALPEMLRLVEADDGQRLALTEVALPGRAPRPGAPAFLLLHGFAQNRKGFSLGPMPGALLERGARVFLGELRGHGDSRVEDGHVWNLRTHLELDCPALLRGVRRQAGVDAVHLIGHSMGGLLGCALLDRPAPLASLTAVASPVLLGASRPLVRLASLALGPLAAVAPRTHRVPMHHLLGALARPLSTPGARGPLWLLQRLTRLANPDAAPPDSLRTLLASADPESPAVMEELARNAVLLRPRIAGVDLVQALLRSPLPVAAVVGSEDIFAPRAAIEPFERKGQAGPRKVVEIPGGTHVDAVMGHHVPATLDQLWDFLLGGGVGRSADLRSPPPEADAGSGQGG